MILDVIMEKRRERLAAEKRALLMDALRRAVRAGARDRRDFKAALKQPGISIIAEIKKASPSKGLIKSDFDPVKTALEYEQSGASAISVLTEEDFFLGSGEYLKQVKESTGIPVLRKDFIFDAWQVWQSAYLGADAILLIAAVLPVNELKSLRLLADGLGMGALVEAHDEDEIKKALESGADIIGINNRNLKTFDVDKRTTGRLVRYLPADITVVSESGVHTAQDMEYLRNLKIDAVLVGESLMTAGDIADKMKELKGGSDG